MISSENGTPTTTGSPVVARSPLPQWTVPVVALLVLVVDVGVTVAMWWWVDRALPDLDKRAAAQLDVLKLAASIAVGGGGLFALYLAARRQRIQELELAQREKVQAHAELVAETNRLHAEKVQEHAAQVAEINRVHAERVAEASERDAAARRVTELYSKSVEQLGSDKAAVRLGGLYALERLAQDNPDQRPTVVRVLCAYLRMPFEVPGEPPPVAVGPEYATALGEHRTRVQEREVRVAAQRILRDHLRSGDGEIPVATFWSDVDLDLREATLVDFDLSRCIVRTADLELATFVGDAAFWSATFINSAYFRLVTFSNEVDFGEATFTGRANFASATFPAYVTFGAATFINSAGFEATTFTGDAGFREATFTGDADFGATTFTGRADFAFATFTGDADFGKVAFTGRATFGAATFNRGADFGAATFAHGVVPLELMPFVQPGT